MKKKVMSSKDENKKQNIDDNGNKKKDENKNIRIYGKR